MIHHHQTIQKSRRNCGLFIATRVVFVVAACLPKHFLIADLSLGFRSAEALIPQFQHHKKRMFTTCLEKNLSGERKLLFSVPTEQSLTNTCGGRARNSCCNEREFKFIEHALLRSENVAIVRKDIFTLWKDKPSMSAKRTSALILIALLSVTTPMPATAEWETAMPSNYPSTIDTARSSLLSSSLSSSSLAYRESSLILALESRSPYTGQLIDTSSANLVRLDSGVSYNDLREGTGNDIAEEGKRVNIQWVLKRSNGYSIDSSAQNDGVPFIFVVGAGNTQKETIRAIPGLDEGIRGMKVGGIRRIVIPPSLAYVEGVGDDCPGPIPPGFGPKQRIKRVMENRMDVPDESFLLDVKLTRVQ